MGLCKTGSQAGCPCDEKICPNQRPACNDPDCGGDNGRAQCAAGGAINGCSCCLFPYPDCSVNYCEGGADGLCTSDKWSGCQCRIIAQGALAGTQGVPDAVPDTTSATLLARAVFSYVFSGNFDSAPWWSPKPTGTTHVTPTDCSFVTTSFATVAVPTMSPVQCWCGCAGGTMVAMAWGTSASSTSSWCLPGPASYAPDGWTQLPNDSKYCTELPMSTTTNPPLPTLAATAVGTIL